LIDLVLKALNSGLPVLGVLYFDNEDGSKGEGGRRQLHYLDEEVRDGEVGVFQWKALLGGNHVPLSRRK
jgi:hypothetical protein